MKLKILNLVIIFVMAFGLAVTASAQESGPARQGSDAPQSYIVVMALNPAIAYTGDAAGFKATKPSEGGKIDPGSRSVKRYTKHLVQSHNNALAAAGISKSRKVNEYTYALNGFSAILSEAEAAALAQQKDVVLVMKDEMRQITTDSSPAFLGLTAPGGAYARGVTGEGVVVGVIDTGIWPEHPSFADDGSYRQAPVPPLPCEFGNTGHNPNDAPFTCNNKLVGAYQMLATYRALIGADPDEFDSARDDNGHGTHTASTAAGNAGVVASVLGIPRGTISGIAPRAHVVAYKGLGNLGGFTSDLAAAIDQAVADGVDVINYSVGGGASLTGADDIAYLFAADAGVFVATSAGNSGPGAGTIGGPASVPWITTVGANTQSRFFQGTIELGNGASYTGASITPGVEWAPLVDAAAAGGDLCVPGVLNPALVSGKIVLCRRGTIGRVAKSLAVLNAGGVGMIMYENSDAGNLFSDSHWTPAVHIDNTPGLAIKAYIAAGGNPTARIVGEQVSAWPYAPSMTDFSSRGPDPVAMDIIKPDITAPGIQILAGNSPFPDSGSVPNELFQAIAGTSMSSPHVAGVGALMKQAHPDWSPAMIKSAMMTTASQGVLDNNRVSPAGPFAMGAGQVNPGGAWNKGSMAQPGLVYEAGFLDYLGFLCGADPSVFANPAATCATLQNAGIPTDPSDLNLASIGVAELPGSQTVTRTVTSVAQETGWRTYQVSVTAPEGYQVTVSPASFRLRTGESAAYSVTIKNLTAPIGAWRFGSLTWNDTNGHYRVYSPMAVKASAFDAPDELQATGASGSLDFDVRFGYTGAYTAAPHGLIERTVTTDNVLQDADQTFSPGDVATGGANVHTFALSGAAFFRVAIPPEATEADADLDVYVFNPSNQLVASSTLGGTDEQVDIFLPANGTWSVYVHGWAAPGGDSDYDMSSWVVPLASGGSLSLVSAPASAVNGTTGTVSVSWAGLNLPSWYLGAVSHTGPSGLMGLTLIDVKTP